MPLNTGRLADLPPGAGSAFDNGLLTTDGKVTWVGGKLDGKWFYGLAVADHDLVRPKRPFVFPIPAENMP